MTVTSSFFPGLVATGDSSAERQGALRGEGHVVFQSRTVDRLLGRSQNCAPIDARFRVQDTQYTHHFQSVAQHAPGVGTLSRRRGKARFEPAACHNSVAGAGTKHDRTESAGCNHRIVDHCGPLWNLKK